MERIGKEEWEKLVLEWKDECNKFGEDFDDYATASLPVLKELACSARSCDAAVYGLLIDGKLDAVCQANSTTLPGYVGKVLRIRHIVLSPRFDFSEDLELDDYEKILTSLFSEAVGLAYGEMPSEHVKFHLRSPAERSFASAFTNALKDDSAFSKVAMKASWVYLSKG